MRKIYKLIPFEQGYGGNQYESALSSVFKRSFEFKEIFLTSESKSSGQKIRKFVQWIVKSWVVSKKLNSEDICILPFEACLFFSPLARNIVLVHHIDAHLAPFYTRMINAICLQSMRFNSNRIKKIVVVSEYWKDYLVASGFELSKIEVVYNFVDIPNIEMGSLEELLTKLKLPSKSFFYIGNHHKKKGVEVVARELLSLSSEVTLCSSGYSSDQVFPNVIHLHLSFHDYLRVLYHAEAVITFSLFKEGWCRTAHEALLLGNEVIGSGAGGMRELLEICGLKSFESSELLKESLRILKGERNHSSIKKLNEISSFENFKNKWIKILE